MINAFAKSLKEQLPIRATILAVMDIRPVVISGPSGVGKSTLIKKLFREYPDSFGFSVSHTTRQMRNDEVNGKQYHFVSVERMEQEIDEGKFIEYTKFSGNYYGTSVAAVDEVALTKKICILDIDEQGVKSIKKSSLDALYVFIKPPSMEELESRLKSRETETEESLKKRMDTAASAVRYSEQSDVYDLVLVNDALEPAFKCLKDFLKEKCALLNKSSKRSPAMELPLAANVKHLPAMMGMESGDSNKVRENGFSEIQLNGNSVAEIPLSPSRAPSEQGRPAEIIVTETPLLVITTDVQEQDLASQISSPSVVEMEADPDATITADGVCGRQSWCMIL